MSDRLATECAEIREKLDELHGQAEDTNQQELIKKAALLLKQIEQTDRERHGATPEDKLVALIESTDECLHCGKSLDEGGFCGFRHFQAYFKDTEAVR